jgi:MscS family membrane protein
MHLIFDVVTTLLADHPSSIRETIRVRFQSFGASSFDIEIFSYLTARNWDEFLRLQEELLLQIREVVQSAKAQLAIPAQTTYLVLSHLWIHPPHRHRSNIAGTPRKRSAR